MISASRENRPTALLRDWLSRVREATLDFLFPSSSDEWLTILRVGTGTAVVLYCWSLRSDWNRIFAGETNSWITRDLMEITLLSGARSVPRISWLVTLGDKLGVSEATTISAVWVVLLVAGCGLMLGLFCRSSAIVGWFLHLCVVKSGGLLSYGVDTFATIGLFYLMLAPFLAVDRALWRSKMKDRHLHGFFRRVLQLHLCVIYFFGGLAKCLGVGWWNGESMWRALTRPPFNVLPRDIVISWAAVLPVMGIAVCVLETAYPIFIWPRRTRFLWLIAIICMHIAIAVTMGLYLFAVIMIILNLAAFGPGTLFHERRPEDSLSAGASNPAAEGG